VHDAGVSHCEDGGAPARCHRGAGVFAALAACLAIASCGGSGSTTASPLPVAFQGRTPIVGTVTVTSQEAKPGGKTTKANGMMRIRDYWWEFRQEMSDPRASGTIISSLNADQRPDGIADMWGEWTLTNDASAWECRAWSGAIRTGGLEHFTHVEAVGTGAYEGLILVVDWYFGEEGKGLPVGSSTPAAGWIEASK